MKLTKNIATRLAIGLIAATQLSACIPLAVVGVGAGVMMATDRRIYETQIADQGSENRFTSRIAERFGSAIHVNATVYNRIVLITGEVPDAAARDEVVKIASSLPNIRSLQNEVKIASASTLSARANDSLITSKIKARLAGQSGTALTTIKVVTEANHVFLLGLVTKEEATLAAEIASTTSGVQSVVKVFEYISEDEARALDGRKN
jgi:osmotically-inducible protein OsmY